MFGARRANVQRQWKRLSNEHYNMKRDLSYLRELLMKVEECEWRAEVRGLGKGGPLHLNFAHDAGLLTWDNAVGDPALRLTQSGCEFLESSRNEEAFSLALEFVRTATGGERLETVVRVLEAVT